MWRKGLEVFQVSSFSSYVSLQSSELMKKKAIVTNDRASLQNTIEELDDSKNKALTEACAKVSFI